MGNIEEILEKLISHPYFEKAKKVREVSAAHTEDSIFTHLMQTLDVAKKSLDGNFITDSEAKGLFDQFMHKEVEGMPYKDIALIVAAAHDIGKIISFKEDEKIYPMNIQHPGLDSGNTYNPGHEYYGSTLMPELLKDLDMPVQVVSTITTVVRLHGRIFDYHQLFVNFPLEDAIRDMKSRVEGYHLEVMFNSYCDIAYNNPLSPCRELIVKMFNHPSLYTPREYLVSE